MTVSNDDKPMSFLHFNISFGTRIRQQAFSTRLSLIFHPRIYIGPAFSSFAFSTLAVWRCIFQSRNFHPCISDFPAFSGLAFSVDL